MEIMKVTGHYGDIGQTVADNFGTSIQNGMSFLGAIA